MLKRAALFGLIMLTSLGLTAVTAWPACNWGGRWSSNWGVITLSQQGDRVDGSYEGGRILSAEVDDNSISGNWERSDGRSGGWFRFIMSRDCNSFKGKWGWNPQRNDAQATGWNGKRVQPIKLLPPSDKPQRIRTPKGQNDNKPAVASIRGYGINYADESPLCFASDYPQMEAAIVEGECKPLSTGLAAVWRGAHYIKDWTLYLEVRDLKSPAPPFERVGIGYTVSLKNARFTDGKKTKTIIVYQFKGRPSKQYLKVQVPISSE